MVDDESGSVLCPEGDDMGYRYWNADKFLKLIISSANEPNSGHLLVTHVCRISELILVYFPPLFSGSDFVFQFVMVIKGKN